MIPEARQGLEQLKLQVMREHGYVTNAAGPDQVKYAVAERVGVPLQHGYNGKITTEQAGKIGGNIGGPMVRELIRRAKESLVAGHRS
jgi:hypothetical protein